MKKVITMLLAISMLLTLCACGNSANITQSQYEALQSDYDELNAKYEKYSDVIDSLEAEDYDAVISYANEKQVEKDVAEKGDIEDYLVTVDITADNFYDYFDLKSFYGFDEIGEEDKQFQFVSFVSKVYDEGLVLYSCDINIGVYNSALGNDELTAKVTESNQVVSSMSSMSEKGLGSITLNRVEGSAIFVKSDYVKSYDVSDEIMASLTQEKQATITLLNGETLYHNICYDYLY